MKKNIEVKTSETRIEKKIRERNKVRRYVALICCVCLMVAGGTAFVLMRPASTQSQITFCGSEEHEHTDACYTAVGEKTLVCTLTEGQPEHEHTDACYAEELICGKVETEGHTHTDACLGEKKVLVCTKAESDGHQHSDFCYGTESVLSCTLAENPGHVHSDSCYSYVSHTCPLAESDGHQHADSCYNEAGELVCGMSVGEGAHHHDSSCTYTESVLSCGMSEGEGAHYHSASCYTEQPVLTCGLAEGEGHHHDDSCYEIQHTYICGKEEAPAHQHDASCYSAEKKLVCTLSTENHTHTDACWQQQRELTCTKPVHEHTLACFANPGADLENYTIWEKMFSNMELTGNWNEDVMKVASSQLGYTESTANYIVDEDESVHGYTRYGAWYGFPYGEWCAMFCSFCYEYAGVDKELMPHDCGVRTWIETLDRLELYHENDGYVPQPGDLVFFDVDNDGLGDHVGFVKNIDDELGMLHTIEGNRFVYVGTFEYYLNDNEILGYGELPENPELYQPAVAAELTEEMTEEAPECTCGASEGEPHAEDCPCYVAPEEEEEAAEELELPECTCGAAEGQPHAEDCPLYVRPVVSLTSAPAEDGAVAVVSGYLPENAQVSFNTISVDPALVEEYAAGENRAVLGKVSAYALRILADGEEWQPDETVSVYLSNLGFAPAVGESFVSAAYDAVEQELYGLDASLAPDGQVMLRTNWLSDVVFCTYTEIIPTTIESLPVADGATAVISGYLPADLAAMTDNVTLLDEELEQFFDKDKLASFNTFASYEIIASSAGQSWQPDEPVSVVLKNSSFTKGEWDDLAVCFADRETGELRYVQAEMNEDGEVVFETDELSTLFLYSYNAHSREIQSEPADDGAVAVVSGILPEGARAEITAVHLTEEELIMYFGAAQAAAMKDYVGYDIKIMVGNTEWQPNQYVKVEVVHPAIEVAEDVRLGVAHVDGETGEVKTVESTVNTENGENDVTVDISTNGFSLYIFYTFTVDFHFGDIVFSIDGRSEILLSELFKELGILRSASEVVNLTFSDPTLLEIEKVEGDWLLKSLQPFSSNEILRIEFADGEVLELNVTDAIPEGSDITYWELVDSTDDIVSGGTYIMIAHGDQMAIGSDSSGDLRKAAYMSLIPGASSETSYYSTDLGSNYWWTFTKNKNSSTYVQTNVATGKKIYINNKNQTQVAQSNSTNNTLTAYKFKNGSFESPTWLISSGSYTLQTQTKLAVISSPGNNDDTTKKKCSVDIYKKVSKPTEYGTVYNDSIYSVDVYALEVDGATGEVKGTRKLLGTIALDIKTESSHIDPNTIFDNYKNNGILDGTYSGAYYGTVSKSTYTDVTALYRKSINNGSSYKLEVDYNGSSKKTAEFNSSNENALYIKYIAQSGSGSSVDPSDKAPYHRKFIDAFRTSPDNPDTEVYKGKETEALYDMYRLYLDVGPEEAFKSVDVLFVLDMSGSMQNNSDATDIKGKSEITRIQALLGLLNGIDEKGENNTTSLKESGLIKTIFSVNEENKVAFTGFAKEGKSITNGSWSDKSTAKAISFTADGATNYAAGLQNAVTMLSNSAVVNDGKRKVMIFISDGAPTYYNKGLDSTNTGGAQNYTDDDTAKWTAVAIDQFRQRYPDVEIYTIGIGDFNPFYLNRLSTSGTTFTSSNFSEIKDELDNIITKGVGHYSNLKVTDTLSDYVDFYSENGTQILDVKIEMIDTHSTDNTGDDTSTLLYSDSKGLTDAGKKKLNLIDGKAYTISGKTISVEFADAYEEEGGMIYRISFNVKTEQAAYTQYSADEKSYLDSSKQSISGDENTDYPGNSTSSEKPGYYSNKSAELEYTQSVAGQDPITKTSPYEMPVIQVYDPDDPGHGGDIEIKYTPPKHYKRIDAFRDGADNPDTDLDNNARDGKLPEGDDIEDLYRLYLDVGPETSYNAVDVLFVLDRSTSMRDTSSAKTATDIAGNENVYRINALNSLIHGMDKADGRHWGELKKNGLFSLISELNLENNIAVVEFNRDSSIYQFTNGTKKVTWISADKIAALANDGSDRTSRGTNYVAALRKAASVLDSSTSGNKQIVIFLSDGEPTEYIKSDGSITDVISSRSSEKDRKALAEATTNAINTFNSQYNSKNGGDVDVYTIAIGQFDDTYLSMLSTSGTVIASSDFSEILAKLDAAITNGVGHYSNLTVTDTLSDYVDFYKEDLDVLVQLIPEDSTDGKGTPLYENGKITKAGEKYLESVTVDYDKKTITVKYKENYKEEGGYIYSVSFNVKTTQKAYDEYAQNLVDGNDGYNGVKGDVTTDYLYNNNQTSVDKPGFHSNAKATLSYDQEHVGVDKREDVEIEYLHPVIQVDTEDYPVKKVWTDSANVSHDDHKIDVTVEGVLKKDSPWAYKLEGETEPQDRTITKQVTLPKKLEDNTLSWEYTFKDLPKHFTYTVTENRAYYIDSTTGNEVILDYTPTIEGPTDQHTDYIITNTPSETNITAYKVDQSNNPISGATFKLYEQKYKLENGSEVLETETLIVDKETNQPVIYETDENGQINFSHLKVYTASNRVGYRLEEVKAPDGYNLISGTPTFRIVADENGNYVPQLGDNTYLKYGPISKLGDGKSYLSIMNTSGYELPKTGGSGLAPIYISGTVIVAAAMIYLCMYRKRERRGKHLA
ncbi:MAG: VWA domain-containing protein [Eubacteriales bacterium]|nr:VWA domain-containing protein [Eubacteriales bacterium]